MYVAVWDCKQGLPKRGQKLVLSLSCSSVQGPRDPALVVIKYGMVWTCKFFKTSYHSSNRRERTSRYSSAHLIPVHKINVAISRLKYWAVSSILQVQLLKTRLVSFSFRQSLRSLCRCSYGYRHKFSGLPLIYKLYVLWLCWQVHPDLSLTCQSPLDIHSYSWQLLQCSSTLQWTCFVDIILKGTIVLRMENYIQVCLVFKHNFKPKCKKHIQLHVLQFLTCPI